MKKHLRPFGVAGGEMMSPSEAWHMTYTDENDEWVPTPLIFPANPFTHQIRNARNILDLGAGVGRNVFSVLTETGANYVGIEPNPSMRKFFITGPSPDRVHLAADFNDPVFRSTTFDVVLSTFTMQHIGYRPTGDTMNVADITREIMRRTRPETIWFLFEHDAEERGWLDRWLDEFGFDPEVYIRNSQVPPELTGRGAYHHLVLFEQERNVDSYTGRTE